MTDTLTRLAATIDARRGADPKIERAAAAERGRERVGAIKSGERRVLVILVSPDGDVQNRVIFTAQDLTQAELARVIGVAGGERVSRWELGTSTPSTAMRARLAKALGIDLEELLPSQGPADLRRLRAEAGLTVAELGNGRWTGRFKQELRDSRITPTELLAEAVRDLGIPTFVSASATGYTGTPVATPRSRPTAPARDSSPTWSSTGSAPPPPASARNSTTDT